MVVTVLENNFPKHGPIVINYRNYKNFNEIAFRNHLQDELRKIEPSYLNYTSFESTFYRVLKKHAPIKKKDVRANVKPFMT